MSYLTPDVSDSNMAESINTLRYAGRAMNIKNTAVKNEGIAGAPVSYAEVKDSMAAARPHPSTFLRSQHTDVLHEPPGLLQAKVKHVRYSTVLFSSSYI